MSLAVPKLEVVKVLDPRLNIENKRLYVALKGALVNSWQQFPATNVNNNQIQITCNPPSRGIAISRLVFLNCTFSVRIQGTNTTAGNLVNVGYIAPRAYPLQNVISSEQMTINNDTITQAPISQYVPAMMWYHNKHQNRFGQYSLTPSMLDQYQNYVDATNAMAFGNNRNPLGPYGDNVYEQNRGGFSGYDIPVQAPGATDVTITLNVTEPLFLSPFVFGQDSNFTSCFVGVQNMAYTATLNNLNRIMSIKNDAMGINITTLTTNLLSSSLLFEYLTPDPAQNLPRELSSSYFSIVSYPTKSSAPIAPNGAVALTMQSIQVTSIPRRMYIYARIDDSLQTPYTSDSYFSVNSSANPLTVTWNNNQFFSQATSMDLYNMSVKNGLQMSWDQWNYYTGSVICIDYSTDLGLMSQESSGSLGNYQLGLTCNFVNSNQSVTITPTLYIVIVYEGTFEIIDGSCTHHIGVLDAHDVSTAKLDPMVTYKEVEQVYGGDFFRSLKNAFHKVHDFVKGNKLISGVSSLIPHPYAKAVSEISRRLGYGRRRKRGGVLVGDGVSGGRRKRSHHLSKMLRGGSLNNESNDIDYDEIHDLLEPHNLSDEDYNKAFDEIVSNISEEKIEQCI